jgi:uncharacterized protein YcbX
MASGEVVGSVAGLWRFPVKSIMSEQLEEATVTERGVVGKSPPRLRTKTPSPPGHEMNVNRPQSMM